MRSFGSGIAKLALLRLPVVVLAGLGALGFAAGVLVGGAAPSASSPPPQAPSTLRPPTPPPPTSSAVWDVPSGLVELPRADASEPKRVLVPGCVLAQYEARQRELRYLVNVARDEESDLTALLAEVRLVLERPCLRHVLAMAPLPPDASRLTHNAVHRFVDRLDRTMSLEMDGRGLLAYIPPEISLDLDPQARAELRPFECPLQDSVCKEDPAFSARAAEHFQAASAIAKKDLWENAFDPALYDGWSRPIAPFLCRSPAMASSLDAWSACAASQIPRTTWWWIPRGPQARPAYRTVSKGWLFLYAVDRSPSSSTTLAAYDLATGSVYSVGRASSCTDELTAVLRTGQVSVEALRELTTALATRPALETRRTSGHRARIPEGVVLAAATGALPAIDRPKRAKDGFVTYRYFDGDTAIEGSFSRGDYDADYHLEKLADVVWASESDGCAPAPLPPPRRLTFQALRPFEAGNFDRLASDLWQREQGQHGLATLLEGLRGHPCTARKAVSW